MNREIQKIFSELGMHPEEIEQCLELCPGIEVSDLTDMRKIVALFVKYGYTKPDLGVYISINPGVLTYKPEELDKELKALGDDVEEVLRENPFAI